jgi:hypothetical protein
MAFSVLTSILSNAVVFFIFHFLIMIALSVSSKHDDKVKWYVRCSINGRAHCEFYEDIYL